MTTIAIQPPKKQHLEKIFIELKKAPQPKNQFEAYSLLNDVCKQIEPDIPKEHRMRVRPFTFWGHLQNFAVWTDTYMNMRIFISEGGDIQIIKEKHEINPEKYPLYFYNICKSPKSTIFKKVHSENYWEIHRLVLV